MSTVSGSLVFARVMPVAAAGGGCPEETECS